MTVSIGEKIKKLRKAQDVTQEKLAEYLDISYQAVSKWENGIALPDITLIPALARFFNISIDTLFDLDTAVDDEKIKAYEAEYKRLANIGDVEAEIALMRTALAEYPRNYSFMQKLASALYTYNSINGENPTEIELKEKYAEEAVRLCERILEDCTEDDIRHAAIQLLCYRYPRIGKTAQAKALAEKMPSMYLCREHLLEHVLTGEEQISRVQANLLDHLVLAVITLTNLVWLLDGELTTEQKIMFYEAANHLIDTLAYDGNYLALNSDLANNYFKIARLHSSINTDNKALMYLNAAYTCALCFDSLPDASAYTSLFLNRLTFQKGDILKNGPGLLTQQLYRQITAKAFDSIRDRPEFQEFVKRLESHIAAGN